MPLTGLSVVVDLDEYSRFESDKDVITATVSQEGTALAGVVLTVALMKARRARDEAAAYVEVTLVSATPDPVSVTFDLPEIVDEEGVPRVRRGEYFIRVTDNATGLITADSSDFRVSLVTVERLKANYLHGTDQMSTDNLLVAEQPNVVTGVEVTSVSRGHPQKWYTLSYNYTIDNTVTPAVETRLLSWCNGPVVSISGPGTYILRRGKRSQDYIKVRVRSLSDLPSQSRAEELLVERKPLDDIRIREILDQAISWLEDSALTVFLEPTVICTEVDPDQVSFPAGTDIPDLIGATWDCKVNGVMYTVPAAGHWIGWQSPYYPIIRFEELYGKVANTRIIDIALEWVEPHERTGWVELVPFNQEAAFNYIGLAWFQSLRGPIPIPNFWNFTALVGFRKTPQILIELVAKKAAMDILTIAGQAFRGGFSSQSISRDGVSESVSYTASATYGIYSATIEEYRKFIDENLREFKGAFRGPNLQVV